MFKILKSQKAVELLLILAAAVLVFILVQPAFAQWKAAGNYYAYAGATNGQIVFSSSSPIDLPTGYMIWSGNGASFYLKRYFEASGAPSIAAVVPLKIPANTPITIPAPATMKISTTYMQMFHYYAPSVTDSLYVIPLY